MIPYQPSSWTRWSVGGKPGLERPRVWASDWVKILSAGHRYWTELNLGFEKISREFQGYFQGISQRGYGCQSRECVCAHITFNPDQRSKEGQDQTFNIHVYMSVVGFGFFLGGVGNLLSACSGQCGQMCVLHVCIWILRKHAQPCYGPNLHMGAEQKTGQEAKFLWSWIWLVLTVIINRLTRLSLGSHVWNMALPFSVLKCILHIHSVRTEFTFCSAAGFWAITCLIWST